GGPPIAVGFEFDNLPAVRAWLGLAPVAGAPVDPSLLHASNPDRHLYNVEHVWYDPRSLAPSSIGFLEADIAIATLDTPANDIPTWVLLFTPLSGPTHGVIAGYGGNGTSASVQAGPLPSGTAPIDWRRRAAENMIDFLGSLDDRNDWIFGPGGVVNPQVLYQMDFDSPAGEGTYTGTAPNYDFDLFQGTALPREGITAGGDSGGPLIADTYFETPVVVGVLSGGTRFHTNQRFSTYGTNSFHQPLFVFWETVVANNPYVYAGNLHGNRDWTNPNHWVQLMDPAYGIELNGELVNALPGVAEYGVNGAAPRFGEVCFLTDCTDNAADPEAVAYDVGTPNSIYVPGGPGTVNFVPNNVVANPALGVRPRYYDVTLSGVGETRVTTPITIDRLTIDGLLTSLDVRTGGTLNVLGDFTTLRGFLNVNGQINSGEAVVVDALITGRGTFNPTYLTSVNGAIAPGGIGSIGTLTVQADTILASNSELLIELGNNVGDRLAVTGDAQTTGVASLGGDLWLTPVGTPRQNQTFTVLTAAGGVSGTFDDVNGFLGVLRPQVTYGANSVTVKLKAGSIFDLLLHNPALAPIAFALDQLRENHYSSLYDLYGVIDLMDPMSLERAVGSLTPGAMLDANALVAMQGSRFGNTLQDRMSLLTRHGGSGLTVSGSPSQVLAFGGDDGLAAASELAFASRMTDSHNVASMPNGVSAFFTGGYDESRSSAVSGRSAEGVNDGLRTWHVMGGVEQTLGAFTMGVAAGYSYGESMQMTGVQADNEVTQTAFYGVYRFENGAYVTGMVGAGTSRVNTERRFAEGHFDYRMSGDVGGEIFLASFETGVNYDLANGLVVTPNFGIDSYNVTMDGFSESGDNVAALNVGDNAYEMLEARLGVRMAGDFSFVNGWSFAPSFDAAMVANLGGDEGGVWANFIAAPDVPFFIPGQGRDDSWGEVNAG
ncbi:MAG TPA: autotransporter domain-containing protein, partial [Terricaulis sp.]|nr:autotransporter domain-containing protein [Terricaulis sp.]